MRVGVAGAGLSKLGLRRLPATGQQFFDLVVFHGRQPPQHIGQVFLGIEAVPAAALNDRVNHGAAPTRLRMSDEEPAAPAHRRGPHVILDQIMPPPDLCRVAA